jgi:hypothetical protein
MGDAVLMCLVAQKDPRDRQVDIEVVSVVCMRHGSVVVTAVFANGGTKTRTKRNITNEANKNDDNGER